MTNEENDLLIELRAMPRLDGRGKAQLKKLERLESKKSNVGEKIKGNAFGTTATTNIDPIPVRMTTTEKNSIVDRRTNIISNDAEEAVLKVGLTGRTLDKSQGLSNSMLLRAAIFLMKDRSNSEVLDAIQQVRLMMIRGGNEN